MSGALLLALSPLLLGVALLLLRQGLYKRGEERTLLRLGRAFRAVHSSKARRDWFDPLLQRAGFDTAQFNPNRGCWAGWPG